MVRFIIIRHGYSKGNKENRFTGQLDLPLDDIGYSQADATARYVTENFKVDSIYSSDLCRAYDTVKSIADKLGLTVNKCELLREIDVGKWQGMLVEDIKREFPESFEAYRTNPGFFTFDGGESYADGMRRGKLALEKIARENNGKTVVIGTHGGIVRTLCADWGNIPLDRLGDIPHVPNASITIAEYNDGSVVPVVVGYNGHLGEKIADNTIK